MNEVAPSPIRFTYTASADDLIHAYQCYNRVALREQRTLTAAVSVLAPVGIVLVIVMPGNLVAATATFVMAAFGAVAAPYVMIRWRVPVLARRIYAQQRDLHETVVVSADAEGLSTRTATGDKRTPWSHYIRWVEDDRVVLLYLSDALFQFVPKEALSAAEIDALRDLAATGGVQAAARG